MWSGMLRQRNVGPRHVFPFTSLDAAEKKSYHQEQKIVDFSASGDAIALLMSRLPATGQEKTGCRITLTPDKVSAP